VSLWFTATVRRSDPLVLDPDEFRGAHWWSPAELDHADPTRFDPHLARFRRKLAGKAEPVRIEAP
jgi:8-oxo-dGTP diphosphatase